MSAGFWTLWIRWLLLPAAVSGSLDTVAEVPPITSQALVALPTPAQLAWQQREVEMFVHFGINTFAGVEWGSGTASPQLFNPTNLDVGQWVAVARSFGARGIVLTCKHHDGFCLWPTITTAYSVTNSPWKGGQGDVVAELAQACREAALAFGVYVSPPDLHEPSFGRDHAAYNEFFRRQLRELLTRYGEVAEVWFDGAQPSPRKQQYDFASYYRLIRELQPKAVIVSKGPDVRWVGNEEGGAREAEWSVLPLPRPAEEFDWPDLMNQDLGSRRQWKPDSHAHWYPAVADVPLRPNWFWSADDERKQKQVSQLLQLHDQSVGRNAGLLLNVSPDRSGKIPKADVRRLADFGEALRERYATNLAVAGSWQVNLAEGGGTNRWTGVLAFPTPVRANAVVLREDIRAGQRVERWQIRTDEDTGSPEEVPWGSGSTIGYRRLFRGAARTVREIRVQLPETRAEPILLRPEVYLFEK